MNTRNIWAGCVATLLVAGTVTAQDAPTRHQLSLAAGYKAAFTCSATFNAGRAPDEIADGELSRIYPSYREMLAGLPDAVIDADAQTVSVAFAEDFPPRVAVWRPHLGCAQLPPGVGPDMASLPPRVDFGDDVKGAAPLPSAGAPASLAPVIDAAFDAETYGEGTRTTAIVVLSEGVILAERYADGFDAETSQRTWSVAKSIAATVVGAAVEQGLIEVYAPAPIPEWSAPGDPRSTITLANLLHMSSGLETGESGSRTDRVYFGGGLVKDNAATTSLEAAPGARWRYANNDTMLMLRALRSAMADDEAFLRFPFETVLHPIGMTNTMLETDWDGDFVLSSQVWTTARDLARLGLLYLQNGVWQGERVLPEDWATFVSTPAPDQPDREGSWGYGAQFWLLGATPGLPEDTYAAAGHRGQYVVIIPSAETVVVRRGFDESGGTQFDVGAFAADVLEALAQ